MINRTKTVQLLRNELRRMFGAIEILQQQKQEALYNPEMYISFDNAIGKLKDDVDTMRELIRFLDGEKDGAPAAGGVV